MRTIIDLPKEHLEALAKLGEKRSVSRAALIRDAVTEYLSKREVGTLDESFGLWRRQTEGEPEDAVAYQRRLRAEWE